MSDVIPLIKRYIKAAIYTIKNSSVRAKQYTFACVALVAIIASLSFTGTCIAYKVNYNGNTIATVNSKKQFRDAISLVNEMVEGNDVDSVVEKPTFSATIVLGGTIDDTAKLADAIIDNTEEIVEATVVYVDDSIVARGEKTMVSGIIDARLNEFNVEGAECTSSFVKNVTKKDGYFMASDLDGKASIEGVVSSLKVVTKIRKTTDVMIPYKSTVKKSDEQIIGYNKVEVAGVSGVNRVTQDIVMLDGEIQSSVDVKTDVVVAPVDEVVVKGTAKTLASAKQRQQATAAGFIFPLPDGSWRVSSYYGDGRRHKGIDICANGGTSIYATASGKVVQAGWNGAYGYSVIVEHDGGVRTLYAHAKAIYCKVGDVVSQGDVIAIVGTTGQSSGNHLHFEVISNGKNVDPAPYINLK